MNNIPFYLDFPDDEVPYSTITRYALLSAKCYCNVAVREIFNNRKKRIHPLLPSQINKIAAFFGLEAYLVLKNQTLYPIIQSTHPTYARKLARSLLQDSVCNASNSIFSHTHCHTFYGLKFCPYCVTEDIKALGFPYWHISHQIYGVEACYRHGCYLHGINTGEGGYDRQLLLPTSTSTKEAAKEIEVKLATFAHEFFELCKIKKLSLRKIYLLKLKKLGFVTSAEHIRINLLTNEITQYYYELNFGSELGVPIEIKEFKFLGPLLRKKTYAPCHPLKHILFACWLTNGEAQELTKCYRGPGNERKKTKKNTKLDQHIIGLLNLGCSINEVYKKTGRSRCYIRRVAELNCIEHESNSQAIPYEIKRKVLIKALFGIHRQEIADSLGLGLGYVEQVICNEPKMSKWRKHLRIQKNIILACEKLKKVKKEHPYWNRTQIRKQEQAAYFMLYNNNKALIEEILPKPIKAQVKGKDWEDIDSELSEKILAIKGYENMSISAIGRAINDHKYLNRKLDKLDKCRELLEKLK
jgi:hypothetical protein